MCIEKSIFQPFFDHFSMDTRTRLFIHQVRIRLVLKLFPEVRPGITFSNSPCPIKINHQQIAINTPKTRPRELIHPLQPLKFATVNDTILAPPAPNSTHQKKKKNSPPTSTTAPQNPHTAISQLTKNQRATGGPFSLLSRKTARSRTTGSPPPPRAEKSAPLRVDLHTRTSRKGQVLAGPTLTRALRSFSSRRFSSFKGTGARAALHQHQRTGHWILGICAARHARARIVCIFT